MAFHNPINGGAALAPLLTREDRRAIAAQIETLIAVLDAAGGDCDLEDDDPAGGNPDDEGEVPDWLPRFPLPVYGIDQRCGPTNGEAHWTAMLLRDREG
ncbi:hypothetical protein [Sphingomonas sp. Leaf37]|uniref:hypothetical protein n=1 Tax=Sphingomonas sp. Leaf37 TaxID=2876552 RepID=UPI001E49FEEA|nr:hypothetical protein [Sphingomonas sp. Leaf37]